LLVRAEGFRARALRRVRTDDVHGAPGEFRNLQRGGVHAPARADDEHRLPGAELAAGDERVPRGLKHERGGGGRLEQEALRQAEQLALGHGDEFRVRAPRCFAEQMPAGTQVVLPGCAEIARPAADAGVEDHAVARL
jgi:hypothetical protein